MEAVAPMPSGSYHLFDHTADIGIDVVAPTAEAVFETAARALFEQIAQLGDVAPRVERRIAVTGADRAELLVRWLAELLYLHDTEGLLFSEFKVTRLSPGELAGRASGEPYDPERHQLNTEIKAVTYHQVAVERGDGGWRARVVFDV